MSKGRSANPYQTPVAGEPAAEQLDESIESLTGLQQLVKDVLFAAKFASLGFGLVFGAILIGLLGFFFYHLDSLPNTSRESFGSMLGYLIGMLFVAWMVAVFWVCAIAMLVSGASIAMKKFRNPRPTAQ